MAINDMLCRFIRKVVSKKIARNSLGRPLNRQARGPGLMNRRSRGTCVFRNVARPRVRRSPRPTSGAIINISYSLWAAEWQRPLRSPVSLSPFSLRLAFHIIPFFFLSCAFLPLPCVIHVDLAHLLTLDSTMKLHNAH
jgi:hypothetical protein